jgi:Fe-S-cluster containining protein
MALEFLGGLFGGRNRLPADHVSRVPRSAKKAAKSAIDGMQAALDKIAGLPGIADIAETKRVPRGFFEQVEEFYAHADAYHEEVRRHLPIAQDVKRPGEPGGTAACYHGPMPVHGIEHLNIYRAIRPWKDFQSVAQKLGTLGEQQFKDIQAGHSGKNPEKIRMGGKAVREGRLTFAKRMEPCPYLDTARERCRIWDKRPYVCRMHHPMTADEPSSPDHEDYPSGVKAKNIRLPVKAQVTMSQLDKRLGLSLSPFLYAGVLQLLQLAEGQPIQEVGEAPQRMQQDGQVAGKANRNVKHAKKFQKKKGKGGKGKRRK